MRVLSSEHDRLHRDVFTQLKRGLDGFWVAHPDFVRIGIAMTEAWRVWETDANPRPIERLIHALLGQNDESDRLIDFVFGPDVAGLDRDHHMYGRGARSRPRDIGLYRQRRPREVRYNIFQALQYFADWLSGNGCVALPAIAKDSAGHPVFVRIMDDLATTERSRWELWAEIQHGRVPVNCLKTFSTRRSSSFVMMSHAHSNVYRYAGTAKLLGGILLR